MIVPSTPIFPPEIQSDNHPGDGNVPIRQTTMAPLEKRTIMARQEPDAPSNVNSGFYSSAISGSLNAKSSPNQLYNTTRVPFNQGVSASIDEGKIRDTYVPHIQSKPSSKSEAVSESTQPDPPTGNPSFSNPMIVPSRASTPIFPPEIQLDDHPGDGNVPIRQTRMAPLEKRAIMARQKPDAPSNVNSGFYSSAISNSGSLNAKPSTNQLYDDTTRVPTRFQRLRMCSPLQTLITLIKKIKIKKHKSPLKQGSEKDG